MKLNVNLASRRYVNHRLVTYGFLSAAAVLALLALWCGQTLLAHRQQLIVYQQQTQDVSAQLNRLRGEPRKPLSVAERVALEETFTQAGHLLKRDAFRWTALLDQMEELVPTGVSLAGFRPDYAKNRLAMTGRARGLKEMRVFLDRLLKDQGFERVFLQSHSRIMVKDYADQERQAIAFALEVDGVF
ncbi:MAG: PilN domain-containing protein [Deltaproteobacteria bacterium]|nr:PilN domain-containing protein [Deltaproteobacteria bacterium]